jgi:hypothetical protein
MHRKFFSTLVFAVFAIPSAAFSQCVATAPNASVGASVRVTATLPSPDPNENGEGEPLVIRSSGGELTASVPDYEVPHTLTFTAAQNGVSVNGTIANFDSDESCELTISANRFSDAVKQALAYAAGGFGLASGGLWVGAEICTGSAVGAPICGLPLGLAAAGTSTIAGGLALLLAADPPDTNYKQVATPTFAAIAAVSVNQNLTQAEADAANTLFENESLIVGYIRAMLTTINRLSTAESANDQASVLRQKQALAGFQFRMGNLLENEAMLRQTLAATVRAAEHIYYVSSSQVFQEETKLAGGWATADLASLNTFEGGADMVDKGRRIIVVQDPISAAGTIPDVMARPALISALQQAAASMRGVQIQINPGMDSTRHAVMVSPNHAGTMPVVLLSSPTFNPAQVDPQSVRLGPAGAQAVRATFMDVNKDGIPDLVLYASPKASGIQCGDTSLTLTGLTSTRDPFIGGAAIRTPPCQ